MYLVDTNIIIRAIIGEEPSKSFLADVTASKQLYLSVIVVGEFLSRASKAEEISFQKLLDNFPVLAVDLEVAKVAAVYRKKFLKTRRVQLLDYFLAAQAKLNDLTLATHNKSDFPMKDIKIITL